MRTLRAASYRRMPWKNGGGETIEMVVSPAGASFDSFDWRLSMAHVGAPGPFSLFPDIDRTLSVINGDGLTLTLPDRTVTLDRCAAPFAFPGDVAVDSTLTDGAIDDLNVMTRRSRCRHRVTRHGLTAPTRLALSGEIAVLIAIGGGVEIAAGSHLVMLGPKDTLVLDADDATTLTATPQGTADLFVVEIAFG
ncbi:HutD/Ves family protein [Bradyrhizobium sp. 2TAF24]|uniref:HutD/Ves family protein n=1 Tax=Bradyrhizobium sp. 2TAF24 TaxID=3233011 RepID=UPI003F93A982